MSNWTGPANCTFVILQVAPNLFPVPNGMPRSVHRSVPIRTHSIRESWKSKSRQFVFFNAAFGQSALSEADCSFGISASKPKRWTKCSNCRFSGRSCSTSVETSRALHFCITPKAASSRAIYPLAACGKKSFLQFQFGCSALANCEKAHWDQWHFLGELRAKPGAQVRESKRGGDYEFERGHCPR